MSTEEFNSVLEGFSEETLVSVDDLIEQTDAFISDSGVDGEGGIDLSGYGNAAASWKKIQESINGTIQQDEGDGDQEVYEQLSPESKMDYLEAALEVDNAVWDVLRSVLENRLDGLTELAKAIDIDLKGEAEKGVRVISGIIDLVNEVKLKIDVGFDEERYENRIRISNINSSYSLLEQTLYAVCTAVSYGDKVLE